MPHAGYSNEAVHKMYDEMTKLHEEAKAKHMMIVVGGDFHAVLGKSATNGGGIGKDGLGYWNKRGHRFANRLRSPGLAVVNIWFRKPNEKLWTPKQVKSHRQIHFGGVDEKWRKLCKNAKALDILDLGRPSSGRNDGEGDARNGS